MKKLCTSACNRNDTVSSGHSNDNSSITTRAGRVVRLPKHLQKGRLKEGVVNGYPKVDGTN